MKKFVLITTVIYMALIFYLSSIPLGFLEIIKFDPTKFSLHVIEYIPLGILLSLLTNFKFSFLIGSLYGLSDEVHQYFVPFRTFSLLDWLADSIGIAIGIIIAAKIVKAFKIESHK
jgi:VanZ family protein